MFLVVGVEPHDVSEDMPDIMEIRKKKSPGEDSFYNHPDINQMSIQVILLEVHSHLQISKYMKRHGKKVILIEREAKLLQFIFCVTI